MLSFLSDFTDKVHEYLGSSQREAAPSNVTSITNASPAQRSFARAPSVEEVPGPAASRIGKRHRGGKEVSPAQGSKSSRSSGNANNLVPNYQRRPPQNSTPIAVPTYEAWKDWRPVEVPKQPHTMGGPYRSQGGVKPLNTLDRPSQQSAGTKQMQRQQAPAMSVSGASINAAKQPRLDVSKSKGSNVPSSLGCVYLGESQQPPVKKRKLDPTQILDPVDLTSDDEHPRGSLDLTQGRAIPARHAGTSAASQKSATELSNKTKKRQSQDLFGNDEMSLADEGLSHKFNGTQKNFRRGKDPSRSLSPYQPRQGRTGRNSGTAQTPVVLDVDDDGTQAQTTGFNEFGRTEPSGAMGMLPMDLGRGLKEAGEEHQRKRHKSGQGSAEDLRQVNDVMESAGYAKPKHTQAQTRPRPVGHSKRKITQTGRLSEQFVRDGKDNAVEEIQDDDPVVSREPMRNVRTKLQQTSTRPRTADQSPDELTGARTVLSGKSRSTSPTKGIPVISRSEHNPNGVSNMKISASQLQPNHFTQAPESTVSRAKDPEDDIWSMSDEEDRIAIDKIICKGYAATHNGRNDPALVWEPKQKSFILRDATGTAVKSPIGQEPIILGASAIAHGYRHHVHSLKVILKGSKTRTSSGSVLIEFADHKGKNMFYNALCDCTGMREVNTTPYTLESIFKKLGEEEFQGYLKAVEQAQRREQHKSTRAPPPDNETRIIYEAEKPPRETIVSRMKERTLPEVLQEQAQRSSMAQNEGETTSHYFHPEPTRRSMRQSNPAAKSREPTPEPVKWTKLNGIPKWAKPILYPEQGTRQATFTAQDLTTLDAGELLNDNIVNYALRDIEEKLPPGQKDRFHFFNTFFYTSLTAKNGKRAFNYEGVKKWTKKVDLFTKEFIVVPINLNLHWFLIIIHNLPSIDRKPLDDGAEQSAEDAVNFNSEHEATPPHPDGTQSRLAEMTLSDAVEPTTEDAMLERMKLLDDNLEPDEGLKSNTKTRKGKKKKHVPPARKFLTNQPRVVCLDSFGAKRNVEVRLIKDYIIAEAREKRAMDITREQLQGVNASGLPLQDNFYDCGVYLIGYMKEFAKDPDRFLGRVLGREMAASDFVAFNTTAMRDEYRDKMLLYGSAADEKYRKEKKEKLAKRMAQNEDPGNTTNKLASSQPLCSSPKSATPITSTNAVRGSPEPPTSNTFPGSFYEDHGSTKDGDDLELDIPHPLQTSEPTLNRREPSHRTIPSDVAEVDNEMLDIADPPEDNPRTSAYSSATPHPQHAASGHNSNLNSLSSLAMDARRVADHPAASVSDARPTVSGRDRTIVKIRKKDEIKQEDKIIKYEDKIKHNEETKPTVGVKDGAQNAPDTKDERGIVKSDDDHFAGSDWHDQQEWKGLDEHEADRSVEIPDSQPEK